MGTIGSCSGTTLVKTSEPCKRRHVQENSRQRTSGGGEWGKGRLQRKDSPVSDGSLQGLGHLMKKWAKKLIALRRILWEGKRPLVISPLWYLIRT